MSYYFGSICKDFALNSGLNCFKFIMVRMTINLSSRDGLFYTGDILKGTVTLQLTSEKSVNGLYIKLSGKAVAQWSTRSGKSHRSHEGKEVYLSQKTYLYGREHGQPLQLSAGVHRYDFEVLLPPGLPPSLQLQHGSIRYYVEGCLDIPWRFDEECKVVFRVAHKDDFNKVQQMKVPKTEQAEIDTSTCFTLSRSPLKAKVTIPQSVFTPGSYLPVTICLENGSNLKVDKTDIKLKQNIKYHSYQVGVSSFTTKEDKLVVASGTVPGIGKRASKTMEVKLQIPNDAITSTVVYCNVIEVSYMLNVVIHRHKMQFPITIALVPLRNDAPKQNLRPTPSPHLPINPIPTAPDEQNLPIDSVNSRLESPPPSFHEAIKKEKFSLFI